MELTDDLKVFLRETARTLTGSARRVFMARAVRDLGDGGAPPSPAPTAPARPPVGPSCAAG